jgi:hypothetical protein
VLQGGACASQPFFVATLSRVTAANSETSHVRYKRRTASAGLVQTHDARRSATANIEQLPRPRVPGSTNSDASTRTLGKGCGRKNLKNGKPSRGVTGSAP